MTRKYSRSRSCIAVFSDLPLDLPYTLHKLTHHNENLMIYRHILNSMSFEVLVVASARGIVVLTLVSVVRHYLLPEQLLYHSGARYLYKKTTRKERKTSLISRSLIMKTLKTKNMCCGQVDKTRLNL